MHERQIYHGKLHGENVLVRTVDNEEKLCLVDYAYTNLCTRDAITLLVNAAPSFCGRKIFKRIVLIEGVFSAPEILRGETFSPATDMWQLGILIFYCLVGTYPFQGSRREIFKRILNGKIEYKSDDWDHISSNGRVCINQSSSIDNLCLFFK